MKDKKPLILISNDDGYHSGGIRYLVEFLKDMADILVCAPESARSGYSCAFSAVEYLRLKRRYTIPDVEVWSCSGTPVDCVKIALDQFCKERKPDLILGGINHGDNSSVNVHYSGTMGAVIEGAIRGIPSVAFSLCDHDADADFDPAGPYIRDIVEKVLERGLPVNTCLNVNFPKVKELKGVRICEQARGVWINEWESFAHRGDTRFFWMAGEYQNTDPENEKSDRWALENGYVAITPTLLDVTARELIDDLKSWF
jgi:5'-nucleotidase